MSTVETPPAADGATPAPEAATRPCPRCGAGLRPDQDWCLSCGAAVTTEVRRPPSWRLPVALIGTILLLALGAIAIAFLEVADDGRAVAQATPTPTVTPVPTPTPTPDPAATPTPSPDAGGTTPGTTVPGADDTTGGTDTDTDTDTDTGTDDDAATGTAGDADLASWPDGEAAWTVVMFSGESREDAEARARELGTSGTTVGVLDSDQYETLNGGYWVVFSGQYESRAAAESAAERLRSSAEGAYPRFVDPR